MSNQSKYNTYIGIDQSLNSTGVYVIRNGAEFKYLISGKGLRDERRLHHIFTKLTEIFDTHSPGMKYVCMEGYAYDAVGRVFELGEVGGIVKLLCAMNACTLYSVPPSSLKKFATGNSSASKETMMAAMGEEQNDVADAKALCLVARESVEKKSSIRRELEVISQITKAKSPVKKKKRVSKPRAKRGLRL